MFKIKKPENAVKTEARTFQTATATVDLKLDTREVRVQLEARTPDKRELYVRTPVGNVFLNFKSVDEYQDFLTTLQALEQGVKTELTNLPKLK